ncbi:MAG: histidine--tRNA ligase [Azospirillaceae bacterium]
MSETRAAIVKPQPISGFPEWLPEEKLVETRLLDIIRRNFERYGFAPIETPAVERKEVLQAKGVESKEIYALARLAAEGEGGDPATEMALHFDLTVPLARYVAQHYSRLAFPFRRYQIQKVWRGERPQAGRFREFYQCDIDIVGNGTLDVLADAEIPSVIDAIFSEAAIGRFLIRINNRKVLQGVLAAHGVAEDGFPAALRAIDALEKIGREKVAAALVEATGLAPATADTLLDRLIAGDLERLDGLDGGPLLAAGLTELAQVGDGLAALGVPPGHWAFDLTIARGLDYYTGTVYETRLVDHPEVGSICSGGRYDDLASTFTKQKLPGVGISIGLTRMLSRLFEAGVVRPGAATPAPVLVTVMDRALLADCLGLAAELRRAGIATEVYSEPRKLGQQLKYADQKGFLIALILGESEKAAGEVQAKLLASAEQESVGRAGIVAWVKERLAA